MPDLAAWQAELREAVDALGAGNLILTDHLLTNVQLKLRALRATQLLEAAQARKEVLPPQAQPRNRRGTAKRERAGSRIARGVWAQLGYEED